MSAEAVDAVRLRGHHVVCLHFYQGEGYSEEFVANLWRVMERLETARFTLTEGADDVCESCPSLHEGVCVSESGGEAEIRRINALARELLGLEVGAKLEFAAIRERLVGVLPQWRASACAGCGFESLCAGRIDALVALGADSGLGGDSESLGEGGAPRA